MNGLIWFWHESFFRPVIHYVLRKLRCVQIRVLPPLKLFPKLRTLKISFRRGISIVERAINLARERWTLRE